MDWGPPQQHWKHLAAFPRAPSVPGLVFSATWWRAVPRLFRPSTSIHFFDWPGKAQHIFTSTQQTLAVVRWDLVFHLGGRFFCGRPTSFRRAGRLVTEPITILLFRGWPSGFDTANNRFIISFIRLALLDLAQSPQFFNSFSRLALFGLGTVKTILQFFSAPAVSAYPRPYTSCLTSDEVM